LQGFPAVFIAVVPHPQGLHEERPVRSFRRRTPALLIALSLLGVSAARGAYTRVATLAGGVGTRVFNEPRGLAVTPQGELLVADRAHHQIKRVSRTGVVSVIAGTGESGETNGVATAAKFNSPAAIAFDAPRNLIYVADMQTGSIRKIAADGTVSTFATGLGGPQGLTVDAGGNLYVSESGTNKISEITSAGVKTTIAGTGQSGKINGAALQATFQQPNGLAISSTGALYIADQKNHLIRKLENGVVSTLAGSGSNGAVDGPALSAKFTEPRGIVFDSDGNLLVSDSNNHLIRLVSLGASPTVTTIAGTGNGGYVDGPPLSASFKEPNGIVVYGGAILIADQDNNAIRAIYPAVSLLITSPQANAFLSTATTTVTGTLTWGVASLSVNGQTATLSGTSWSATIALPSGDGAKTITAVATDTANNQATATVGVTLDATAPAIAPAVTPAPNAAGWNRSDTTVSFNCADATSGVATCTAATTLTAESAGQAVGGRAVDNAGNSATTSLTIRLDKTAPVIGALTPAPGSTLAALQTTISGSVMDALSGITAVTCGGQAATLAAGTFSCAVTLLDGGNDVVILATDAAGNSATTSVHYTVNRDQQPPVVSITTPAEGFVTNAAAQTVTGTATDDVAVASVTVNGQPATRTGSNWTASIALSGDSSKAITATATDTSNKSTSATVSGTLDTTPPVVAVQSPAGGSTLTTSQVTITGTVTDAGSGVTSVTCGGQPATAASGTFTCSVTLAVGANDVVIMATDLATNSTTTTLHYIVTTDQTAPTIRVTTPSNGAVTSQMKIPVSGTVSDDVGVASVTVNDQPATIDGNTWTAILDFSGTPEGSKTISVVAKDHGDNASNVTLQIVIDTIPPSVVVTSPSGESAVKLTSIDVNGEVTDAGSGVASVFCNGAPATVTGLLFQCHVSLAAGSNMIGIVVHDAAGNVGFGAVTVVSDNVPPEITLIAPTTAFRTNAPTVRFAGRVTDDDAVAGLTIGGHAVALAGSSFDTAVDIEEGVNAVDVVAADRAGNQTTQSVSLERFTVPAVVIDSPTDLSTLTASSISVTGVVSIAGCNVTVNGIGASVSGSTFSASGVPLAQGRTVVSVVAVTPSGRTGSAAIHVYRDSIPPRVVLRSPLDRAIVLRSNINVTGMVDDVVVGTINAGQAHVTVNGIVADVANRAFIARNVPLVPGLNTLTVVATDQGGNTVTLTSSLTYDSAAQRRIVSVSGDNQTGPIGVLLPTPLVVRVVDALGTPQSGQIVVFDVVENNGTLMSEGNSARTVTTTTDAQGEASIRWTLGTRAGAGNSRVIAQAEGSRGIAEFDAVVDAGSNRVANVPVIFTVVDGGGNFKGQETVTVTTDSDGRAWTTPTLGVYPGNNVFSATFAGTSTHASFVATGKLAGEVSATMITGVVLDNTDQVVPGVSVRIEGTSLTTETNDQGQFVIAVAPVGYVKLFIDGSTARRPGTWPTLEFAMYTIPGADNTLEMPIHILPIDVRRGLFVDETNGGTLLLPELPGFSLNIKPGSATFPGGNRTGTVSVTLVHADKVPMAPGFGQQPKFIVTIQPPGVHFDPPAALTFPNVDGLAPGQVTEMYSFDHDLGQFVSIGTASVSPDGSILRSDPGVGIIKGGWHCGGDPAANGTSADCPECKKCFQDVCKPATGPTDTYRFACCYGVKYSTETQCCVYLQLVPVSPWRGWRECPQPGPNHHWSFNYDGCSIPSLITPNGVDPNNPAGGTATQFSGYPATQDKPCDAHDECYQTCNPEGKDACDLALLAGMLEVCAHDTVDSDVEIAECKAAAQAIYQGVHWFGGIPFINRQVQVCDCCDHP